MSCLIVAGALSYFSLSFNAAQDRQTFAIGRATAR
jgi:hypothetical protein